MTRVVPSNLMKQFWFTGLVSLSVIYCFGIFLGVSLINLLSLPECQFLAERQLITPDCVFNGGCTDVGNKGCPDYSKVQYYLLFGGVITTATVGIAYAIWNALRIFQLTKGSNFFLKVLLRSLTIFCPVFSIFTYPFFVMLLR